jgi:hypothetical protein
MAVSTFVTPAGDEYGRKYFQDVEISPATLKDGSLVQRFDVVMYPGNGRKVS